jgi:hypothetical protein
MEFLFEILIHLVQLVGELLLQGLFELLVEVGLHSLELSPKVGENPGPVLAAGVCLFLGMLSGVVSLIIVNHSLISHVWLRIANLVITPCIAGWIVVLLGRWRQRRNPTKVIAYRAVYGFLFAFAFVLTRLYVTSR